MKLLVLLAAACVGAPAFAQAPAPAAQVQPVKKEGRSPGIVLGVGIESLAYGFEDLDLGIGFTALQARAGYVFNQYISIEAQASLGLQDYVYDSGTLYDDTSNELGANYGVFLVPRLPIGRTMALYARLGWLDTEIEGASGDALGGSGPSAGLGFGIDINKLTIGVDLTLSELEFKDSFGSFDAFGASFATSVSHRF